MKTTLLKINVFFVLWILFSCTPKTKTKEHEILAENIIELNAEQFKIAGIRLGVAGKHTITDGIKVNGSINVTPQNIASVSAPLGGFVKNTMIMQGSTVVKGEPIALIENFAFIEIQQGYLETKARYLYVEIEFKRHNELYKENVYSEKNLQQTETEYKMLKAQMRGMEQKLIFLGIDPLTLTEEKIKAELPLYAPISGYIRTVNLNIGKFVNPTDVLCEIVNPEHIVLELSVFEKDVQKVSAGQKVLFSTPNYPNKEYSATIYQAGKVLDNNKTAMTYAKLDQTDPGLISGMFVNAHIETSSCEVEAVPEESIVRFNERSYIFVFKGEREENGKIISDFEAVEVKKRASDQGYTAISLPSGYDLQNKQIVVKGAYSILSAWKNAGEMAC